MSSLMGWLEEGPARLCAMFSPTVATRGLGPEGSEVLSDRLHASPAALLP